MDDHAESVRSARACGDPRWLLAGFQASREAIAGRFAVAGEGEAADGGALVAPFKERPVNQMKGSHSILGEPPASVSVLVILLPPLAHFLRGAADSQFIQKG